MILRRFIRFLSHFNHSGYSSMITEIRHRDEILAIILSREFNEAGIHFVTPASFSQQLAYMRHPAGKVIQAHVHNPVIRDTKNTLEVLFLRRGRLRVDFFTNDQRYLESRILEAGDVILLASGGHGFEVLEEIEMVEVKQGPYAGDRDKTRFCAKLPAQLNFGHNGADPMGPKQQSEVPRERFWSTGKINCARNRT